MFHKNNTFNVFVLRLFLFIIFHISFNCGFNTNDEILEFIDPASCKNNEYFDTESFSCTECDATRHLEPSHDRSKCICNKYSKTIGFGNGNLICSLCGLNETVTTDGLDCIPCKNDDNNTCECTQSEIREERNTNGTLLDAVQCLSCTENSYPSLDGTKCLPCHRSAYSGHISCVCPLVSHVKIQQYCLRRNGFTDWPDIRSTYLIKFENQSIDSYYFRTELQLAVYLCKNRNRTACEHLSNMCALTLFTDGVACKPFLQKHGSPSWLFYGEGEAPTILNRRKITQRYSLRSNSNSSKLNITVAAFSLTGEFNSIGTPNVYCNLFNSVRFGINLSKQCKITARELLSAKVEFFVPNLAYLEKGKVLLYALPILIKNTNEDEKDALQWRLVRKFFLVDSVTGFKALPSSINASFKREPDLTILRYVKSLCILVKVQKKEQHGKIFPPLFIIEYGELTRQQILENIEVPIDYKVTYILANNNMYSAMEVSTGVLSGFAVTFSGIKAWSYCRRNGNGVPNIATLLWFLIYCSGTLGNVFLLVSLGASVYTFIFYKWQTVLHVLLPSDDNEDHVRVFTVVALCLKVVETIAFIYRHWNVNVFFVDWEQPRTVQTQSKYDSPHTSLRKLYANRFPLEKHNSSRVSSDIISARRIKTPSKSSEVDSPRSHSSFLMSDKHNDDNLMERSNLNFSMGETGDHNELPKLPVSIWRTYFIANEWLKIQTKRKISIVVQAIFTLFILEIVGLKFWALPIPELTVESQDNFAEMKQSFTLRYAVGTLVYIFVYCIQWLIFVTFYERYVKNYMQEFVDLCSIANISVFIMSLNYYGFYIHGRSVHGFADTDLATLINDLRKEQNNLCAHRGLVPGTTEQTFIISMSTIFRAFYNKLFNSLKSDENRFLRKDISSTSNWERNLQTHLRMKKFLISFLDHCLKDLDYVVKDRQFLEKLCDIEFTDAAERSVFYTDNNHSFDRIMFYGNEWTLATFEITLFIFIDMLWGSYILAIIIIVFVSQSLIIISKFNGKRNLASKTLIDQRFLLQ